MAHATTYANDRCCVAIRACAAGADGPVIARSSCIATEPLPPSWLRMLPRYTRRCRSGPPGSRTGQVVRPLQGRGVAAGASAWWQSRGRGTGGSPRLCRAGWVRLHRVPRLAAGFRSHRPRRGWHGGGTRPTSGRRRSAIVPGRRPSRSWRRGFPGRLRTVHREVKARPAARTGGRGGRAPRTEVAGMCKPASLPGAHGSSPGLRGTEFPVVPGTRRRNRHAVSGAPRPRGGRAAVPDVWGAGPEARFPCPARVASARAGFRGPAAVPAGPVRCAFRCEAVTRGAGPARHCQASDAACTQVLACRNHGPGLFLFPSRPMPRTARRPTVPVPSCLCGRGREPGRSPAYLRTVNPVETRADSAIMTGSCSRGSW